MTDALGWKKDRADRMGACEVMKGDLAMLRPARATRSAGVSVARVTEVAYRYDRGSMNVVLGRNEEMMQRGATGSESKPIQSGCRPNRYRPVRLRSTTPYRGSGASMGGRGTVASAPGISRL